MLASVAFALVSFTRLVPLQAGIRPAVYGGFWGIDLPGISILVYGDSRCDGFSHHRMFPSLGSEKPRKRGSVVVSDASIQPAVNGGPKTAKAETPVNRRRCLRSPMLGSTQLNFHAGSRVRGSHPRTSGLPVPLFRRLLQTS